MRYKYKIEFKRGDEKSGVMAVYDSFYKFFFNVTDILSELRKMSEEYEIKLSCKKVE